MGQGLSGSVSPAGLFTDLLFVVRTSRLQLCLKLPGFITEVRKSTADAAESTF